MNTMKRSRLSESQILAQLKEADQGKQISTIARENGISETTLYHWRP
jgi:Transposase.